MSAMRNILKLITLSLKGVVELPLKYKVVTGTTDIGTNSVTPVDMTGMTMTITTGNNPVLILAHVPVGFDGSEVNNQAWVFLVVDDDYKAGFRVDYVTRYDLLGNIAWLGALSAGEHTIKLQWYVAFNTSQVVQLGESGFPRHLIAIELVDAQPL